MQKLRLTEKPTSAKGDLKEAIIMLLAKDNKDTYDKHIRPIFEFT
jgi:hypothetical protein